MRALDYQAYELAAACLSAQARPHHPCRCRCRPHLPPLSAAAASGLFMVGLWALRLQPLPQVSCNAC